MSGSFPIAFESQKWEQEWGKYYIHYGKTRREIDLTNKRFTDGGMLANFPLKYLDNERMRPKYFAHPRIYKAEGSETETILIGMGSSFVETEDEEKAERI